MTLDVASGTLRITMLRAYFDTNVYDHIDKGRIPAGEVEAARAAMASGGVVAYLGLAVVEEMLGQWDSDQLSALRKLQLARGLVGFNRLLKAPAMLVEDQILAYASGIPPPAPTLPREYRRFITSELSRVADASRPSLSLSREVSQIVADVRATKERFRDSMTQALERTLAELKPETYSAEERRALTFEAFWERGAASWAEALADRGGVAAACRERGLKGLLNLPAVRLGVGSALSLVFSQVVERAQPHLGDGYDQWHAIQASSADVFVTRERRLARLLAQVPIEGFRVVRSLRELLAGLEPAGPR